MTERRIGISIVDPEIVDLLNDYMQQEKRSYAQLVGMAMKRELPPLKRGKSP